MYPYAHQLAGKKYKIGYDSRVLTTPPSIRITAVKKHYLDRKFERGGTSKQVLETVKNPLVALHQWNGARTVFVTPEMTVVLTSAGEVVTVWLADDYDSTLRQLLADAGY